MKPVAADRPRERDDLQLAVRTIVPSVLVTDTKSIVAPDRAGRHRVKTALHPGWVERGRQVLSHLIADGINRVVLLSDGKANLGLTDPEAIADEVRELARQGVGTTTMGVGDNFNEDLMEAMARAGGGNYYYIESPDQLPMIFQAELEDMMTTVGYRVTLGFEPANGVTVSRVLNDFETNAAGEHMLPERGRRQVDRRVVRLNVPAREAGAGASSARSAWNGTAQDVCGRSCGAWSARCLPPPRGREPAGGTARQSLCVPLPCRRSVAGWNALEDDPSPGSRWSCPGRPSKRDAVRALRGRRRRAGAVPAAKSRLSASSIVATPALEKELDDIAAIEADLERGELEKVHKRAKQQSWSRLSSSSIIPSPLLEGTEEESSGRAARGRRSEGSEGQVSAVPTTRPRAWTTGRLRASLWLAIPRWRCRPHPGPPSDRGSRPASRVTGARGSSMPGRRRSGQALRRAGVADGLRHARRPGGRAEGVVGRAGGHDRWAGSLVDQGLVTEGERACWRRRRGDTWRGTAATRGGAWRARSSRPRVAGTGWSAAEPSTAGDPALPAIIDDRRADPRPRHADGRPGQRFRILRPHARGGLGEVSVALDDGVAPRGRAEGDPGAVRRRRSRAGPASSSKRRSPAAWSTRGSCRSTACGQYPDGRPYLRHAAHQGREPQGRDRPAPPRPGEPRPRARRMEPGSSAGSCAGSSTSATRSTTPTAGGSCTATSSPTTSCSASTARPWWSTGAWPSAWPAGAEAGRADAETPLRRRGRATTSSRR